MRFQRFNLFEQAGHVHRFGIEVIAACGDRLFRRLRREHCIGRKKYFERARTRHQNRCRSAQPMSLMGLVSRVTPVHTAVRNCTRDEGRPFEVGNQVLISSHRKLLSSKAMVVNVAEKSERDFGRYD